MTVQETIAKQELAGIDLNQVTALQQKRTLAFVNHFVLTTVQFLNSFMKKCEFKLMQFESKLEKVEAAMVLLEARLSSIPEVNTESEVPAPKETQPEVSTQQNNNNSTDTPVPDNTPSKEPDDTEQVPDKTIPPEYERFIKMVQVGVPLQAVKLKASLEGLDPDVLVKIIENK